MRHLLSGNAAARGSALGRARVRLPHALDVEETRITAADVDAELERIHEAVDIVRAEMHTLRQRLHGALAHEVGEFVDLHALLLDDPELLQGIDALIRTGLYSADYALRLQRDRIAAVFEGMDDAYLRSRIDDIDQVMGRLHAALHRREADLQGVAGEILVTDSIAPAELAQLQAQGVVGVVTAGGSPLSHSAILARSLHLPLVVGATQALLKVNDGDVLVIDGASGLVVLEPNAADLRAHHKRVIESKRERRELNRLRREPSRTLDGVDIKLWANAESRDDVAEAHALGAAGVGLYRTEFLFMGSSELPDEETQFRAYRDAVIGMTGRTVTIRTLDLGADKADKTGLALRDEPNPALGLRGVRLSLAREGLLRTQLRAMARASGYGPLRALVPMVSGYEEMRTVRRALDAVLLELRSEGFEVADHVPLGAMIEVPSAAISPHTATGLPRRLAMRITSRSTRSTAGCSGEYSSPSASLVRSAASRYCTRSLVPIDRKSQAPMKPFNDRAAEGTSIIAPSGTCAAISWPSRRTSASAVRSIARTVRISSAPLIIGTSTRTGP